MRKGNYSPCPWDLAFTINMHGWDVLNVVDKNGNPVAIMASREKLKENAHLIKYAPQMHELLEELFDVFNLCTRQAIARWVKNGCNIGLARECAAKNIEYARRIKKLLKEVKGETNEKTEHARGV